jgi:hypothetical protein
MPLKYWDEAFLAATYLINRLPTKTLDFSSPLEQLFHEKNPTTPGSAFLVVLAGPIYDHSTHTSFNFIPNSVCFSVIVLCTKALNVLMLQKVMCIYLVTLSSMKPSFPLPS